MLLLAALVCTLTIDNGYASGPCSNSAVPAPTPAPTPTPTPAPTPLPTPVGGACINSAGQSIPEPTNYRMQTMFPGGTNNYVFDSTSYVNPSNLYPGGGPTGTIQVFELPRKWKDGTTLLGAQVQFASFISYSGGGAQYEIAFSKCKGDFEYYKTDHATVRAYLQSFKPCGIVWGSDVSLGWSIGDASIYSCGIPAGEVWYMNWRVVPGTCVNGSYTCGQTFGIPRG